MSGLSWSRLFLAVGWLGLVFGVAVYTVPVAMIVGGGLLIIYGMFGIDIDTPAKRRERKEPPRDPSTLERRTRVTNFRG